MTTAPSVTDVTLYEDDDLLVVDKPSGMVVNNAETYTGVTLQDLLEGYFGIGDSLDGLGGRAGIVHRLDKATSGLLMVAKTEEAFTGLQAQFKRREVAKQYMALVHGIPPTPEGIIDAPLARNPKKRFTYAVVAGGREAETQYRVVERYTASFLHENVTLVELSPKTGRTHQIRVHMAALGTPLVADEQYAGKKRYKRDLTWCPRLFLHAASLTVTHPTSEERVTFTSELPLDLRGVLDQLEVR